MKTRGYYGFNALVHVHCVEWNCRYFFLFINCILVPALLVLPYYMVNKDEYKLALFSFVVNF